MAVSKSHMILDNSVEPDIYVCTITNRKPKYQPCHHEWYQLRDDSTTSEHKILFPQLTPLPHHLTWSICTSIGSKIYITGGWPPGGDDSKEVYYIDAYNQSDGWKKASSMKAARYRHYAFSHDGQMYVIGGNHGRNSDEPWAEVYDPVRDTWHALPRIPDDVISRDIVGHAVVSGGGVNGNGKRILLHSEYSDNVFYYDLELELLGVYSASILNDSIRHYSSKASSCFAFLDGILYYFGNWDELYAYDISKPNSAYKTVILSPELKLLLGPDDTGFDFCLVSLGNGKLAVITSYKTHHHEYGHLLRIRCTKLHMLKVVNDKGELEIEAKLISHSNHHARGESVDSCLTITQEGASQNMRAWAQYEDLKLIEALRISQIESKHRAEDRFDDEIYWDFVEKILNVTLPESNLKADIHIKTRITTLRRNFEIVDEMIQGTTMRGFEYDDSSKRVVADQSVWVSYLKNDERIAQFKDSRFPLYRELCSVFRNDQEFDIIKSCNKWKCV